LFQPSGCNIGWCYAVVKIEKRNGKRAKRKEEKLQKTEKKENLNELTFFDSASNCEHNGTQHDSLAA
jgi:hypothetical protein